MAGEMEEDKISAFLAAPETRIRRFLEQAVAFRNPWSGSRKAYCTAKVHDLIRHVYWGQL
jgi:hypothetical protein